MVSPERLLNAQPMHSRPDFLTQAADSRECNDGFDSQVLESGNVGPSWHVRWRDVMTHAMSSNES